VKNGRSQARDRPFFVLTVSDCAEFIFLHRM
jgi:hypothetical protein